MPPLLRRFPLFHSAVLVAGLGSCTAPPGDSNAATRAAVLGTYQLVSPYPATSSWRQVPVPAAALELTADHARYHVGSTTLVADYDVTDAYVYFQSETARMGFQRVGADTLRQTDAVGTTTDYVRAH
jgi:hypothetical protein